MKFLEDFLARTAVVDELIANLVHDIFDNLDIDLAGGGSGHRRQFRSAAYLQISYSNTDTKGFTKEKKIDTSISEIQKEHGKL